MATDRPLISIIIPTRNRFAHVRAALQTAQAQSWNPTQIIVVDDASSDGSDERLAALVSTFDNVELIRNAVRLGGGGARNAGIAHASGDYVAFLDDDDLWSPDKLAKQHAFFHANPGMSAVSCGFKIMHGGQEGPATVPMDQDLQSLLRANRLGGASMCFVPIQALLGVDGFDQKLPSGQDWDLWLKLSALGPVGVCPGALVTYNSHREKRITGDRRAEYIGRRRIHLKYKDKMNKETRRHSVAQVGFYRKVVFAEGVYAQVGGLLRVIQLSRGGNVASFAWRLLKRLRGRVFALGSA